MGKMKEVLLERLESDPVFHDQYWLNELFNNPEPVLPTYTNSFMEQTHEQHNPPRSHP
jgi:hypothetical protein